MEFKLKLSHTPHSGTPFEARHIQRSWSIWPKIVGLSLVVSCHLIKPSQLSTFDLVFQ